MRIQVPAGHEAKRGRRVVTPGGRSETAQAGACVAGPGAFAGSLAAESVGQRGGPFSRRVNDIGKLPAFPAAAK
jgi:hypothetical protein